MRFGIHASMLEPRYPLPEALAKAAQLGAESYELDIGLSPNGEPWDVRREFWERTLEQVPEVAAVVGVALPSVCLGALWQYSLASDDPEERTTGVAIVHDALEWAGTLGSSAILLPVGQPPKLSAGEARITLLESLRGCLDAAAEAEVVLALENVSQPLLYSVEDLLELVQTLASPFLGVYFDPGNYLATGGDPAEAVRALGPHLARVHLKDTVAKPRTVRMPPWATGSFEIWGERTTVELGRGELDWAALREALEHVGYDQGFILEAPQSAETAEAGVRANLGAARRLLAG